ncbi:MAG: DUF115 domain-containing protein, partial [Campylobacter sp.]|nr:DUF115 domain-containing protein [Campylobacter sp.]
MHFNAKQKELFEKNLSVIRDIYLKEALENLEPKIFCPLYGGDPLAFNLEDIRDKSLLYQDPIKELNETIARYNENYPFYPVLYFYGFGSGILYKALAQNATHELFVIFEEELETLYYAFHNLDFSPEFDAGRLLILNSSLHDVEGECNMLFAVKKECFLTSRLYFLELHSDYYQKFDPLKINTMLSSIIKSAIIVAGNDPKDALQGIEQFVLNI